MGALVVLLSSFCLLMVMVVEAVVILLLMLRLCVTGTKAALISIDWPPLENQERDIRTRVKGMHLERIHIGCNKRI